MTSLKEKEKRKINTRLYPIYKMISWDLLFYYSIIYLFLTQAKNFSPSQVLLGEAFFTTSCLIMQIPVGLLVNKFGKRNSLIFGNICLTLFTVILIFSKSFTHVIISFFLDAIGYVIKSVAETNILYDSLPSGKKRGSLYSMIDGAGVSRYYVIDAITSLIAGFTYVINPYIPIILCLITNLIATYLSTKFKSIRILQKDETPNGFKEYCADFKEAIKFVIHSKRILYLLIVFGLILGLTYNLTTFRSSVLKQINIPEQYFGLIFALIQIISALCANINKKIHKKFRNKTLTVLGIPLTVSLILIGILGIVNKLSLVIILLFILHGAIKGPFNVLIYRYLNNFTNRNIRAKLATIRSMIYNIFSILISIFGSILLSSVTAAETIMIIGGITTVILGVLLIRMKNTVGLKPEQYNEEDLKYSSISKKS